MYCNVAPYSTHKRHSTPTKYEDDEVDNDEKVEVRPPSHKHRVQKKNTNIILKLATKRKRLCTQTTRAQPNILYVY